MIYLAVLRVQYDGAKFFKQPSEVEDFLSNLAASTPVHRPDASRPDAVE